MTPEKFLEAFDRFEIHNNIGDVTAPDGWYIVDNKTAEPEVNWPGDLVSEHKDHDSARLAWAVAIIKAAEENL